MACIRHSGTALLFITIIAGACSSDRDSQPINKSGDAGPSCGGESEPDARRVATESGVVVGVAAADTDAFLGIPFVASVAGEGRFAEPAPFGCFDGDFQAQTLGPHCPQLDTDQATVIGDEDCLQLNVWTPHGRDAKTPLPVLVFIHGGGNAVGSATDSLYDGQHVASQDALVVTANYRLGALGFLLEDGVPTNLGMRDLLAALAWVQRNIAAFGGDPSNVTVFGESAGAVNTCALLGVPKAKGLLHGAIVQSGTCHFRTQETYRDQIGVFTANVNCAGASDVLACLRALPAESIVGAEPTGYPDIAGTSQGWGPHVDGELMPESTDAQFVAGTSLRVPLIIGSNADETANSVPSGMTRAQFEALVRATFAGLSTPILQQYPESEFPDGSEAWIRLTTEAKFQCGALHYARLAAQGGLNTYLYMFAYDGYTSLVRQARAVHGIELPFIFGTFDAIPIGNLTYTPNANDRQMSEAMQARWLAFANTGKPNGTDPSWPKFDGRFLRLDVPTALGSDEYPSARCDFWEGLLDIVQ